jgi:hypothetical protein
MVRAELRATLVATGRTPAAGRTLAIVVATPRMFANMRAAAGRSRAGRSNNLGGKGDALQL